MTSDRPTLGAMTLTPHITAYIRTRTATKRWTHRTAKSNRYHLATFAESFGARPLNQLTTSAIERWLERIAHLEPASKRTYLSTIRGFCRWLVREGKLRRDPTCDLEPIAQPRQLRRNLNENDVAVLLETLPDARARAIVWVMVGCGLRCVEVSRLGMGDYDGSTLRVTGKGGHERIVPVPSEVAGPLNTYLASSRATAGPMFRNYNHPTRGLEPKTLSEIVSRWMKLAAIKAAPYDGVSAHALRHTAATDVYDLCLDLAIVQAMLGHANIATTSRYIGTRNTEQMRQAMEGRPYAA